MKYTDRFFEFPIRVYDRFTAQKAAVEEETANVAQEGEWIQGLVRIPYREITVWSDYFDSVQGIEGVEKDGYGACIIWTKNEGIFICTLKKKEFEKALNEHVKALESIEHDEDLKRTERILVSLNAKPKEE